jgi:purine-binding chemotaxis protein CheW
VLVFELGEHRLGLDAKVVQELVRAVRVVPLPRAPAVVEGVIDVRGVLVPVLDVRSRFGLPPRRASHNDHLVLARAGLRLVALRADRTVELAQIGDGDLEAIPVRGPGAEQLAGVARLRGGLVLVHDLASFLSQAEAASLDEALTASVAAAAAVAVVR